MPRTGDWEIKELSIRPLYLDAQNPRLLEEKLAMTQREIIADLIRNDRVLDLARDIANSGFIPGELFVATEEENRRVVLEGNRRLAALKLLRNPDLAPTEYKARAQRYSRQANFKSDPKVAVAFAPSREEARPFLFARHTGLPTRPWSLANQARFVSGMLESGESIESLCTDYGFKKSDVRDLVYTHSIYEVAQRIDLPEEIREKLLSPSFSLSTLMRVAESTEGRQWLGISRDDNSGFVLAVSFEEFEKGFARVVSDVANERIDSRRLNTNEAIAKYLSGLGDAKPKRRGGRRTTAKKILEREPTRRSSKKVTRKKRQSRQRTPPLLPKEIKCGYEDGRVRDVFDELGRLPATYPNSAAFLLRSLIDLSLARYLEETGDLGELVKEIRRKRKGSIRRDYHPSLKEMLTYFLENDCPLSGQSQRAVRKLMTNRDDPISIDSMNEFVHNNYIAPTLEQLRRIVLQAQPLLMITLHPPGFEDSE